jgi:hypothetical protein
MEVFHASTLEVLHPDIQHSRKYLDFGPGFYVTTLRQQAINYAERFKRRNRPAWLNTYELDDSYKGFRMLQFEKYDAVWLEFVTECRKGNIVGDYDVIRGGIANDKVFRTIDMYFAGDITKEEALRRLLYEKPNDQICFRTQNIIDECLTFKNSIEL